jgi:hypothetical protein
MGLVSRRSIIEVSAGVSSLHWQACYVSVTTHFALLLTSFNFEVCTRRKQQWESSCLIPEHASSDWRKQEDAVGTVFNTNLQPLLIPVPTEG